MAIGIMIMGSSEAGKMILGKLVDKELGYTFVDIGELKNLIVKLEKLNALHQFRWLI